MHMPVKKTGEVEYALKMCLEIHALSKAQCTLLIQAKYSKICPELQKLPFFGACSMLDVGP